MNLILVLLLGLVAGILSGLFGIGGGIIIIPGLIFLLGFSEHHAVGTSLTALLPPVALLGVIEHLRSGNVQAIPALLLSAGILFGAKLGAQFANRLSGPELRVSFGFFITVLGASLIISGLQRT